MTSIALLGAGGKMGHRLARNLKLSRFDVRHAEVSDAGRARLRDDFSIECVPPETALGGAGVVILAVPDTAIGKVARAHWGVENRLHWVLDVVFHDDLMRLSTADGPKYMATVKHMALNLIKSAPGKDSLRVKRKAAGWDAAFLLAIIQNQNQ